MCIFPKARRNYPRIYADTRGSENERSEARDFHGAIRVYLRESAAKTLCLNFCGEPMFGWARVFACSCISNPGAYRLEYKPMATTTLKGRMLKAGGWSLVRRMIKPVPIVGAVFAIGLAGYVIKKKGLLRGVIDVGLDVTPVVGTAKNVVEIFTGDLIRDKHSLADKPAKPNELPAADERGFTRIQNS